MSAFGLASFPGSCAWGPGSEAICKAIPNFDCLQYAESNQKLEAEMVWEQVRLEMSPQLNSIPKAIPASRYCKLAVENFFSFFSEIGMT